MLKHNWEGEWGLGQNQSFSQAVEYHTTARTGESATYTQCWPSNIFLYPCFHSRYFSVVTGIIFQMHPFRYLHLTLKLLSVEIFETEIPAEIIVTKTATDGNGQPKG